MIYKKASFLLILYLFIFSLINCSKDSPTSSDESKEIWPLKVGNYWLYVISSNMDSIVEKIEVIGTKMINNNEISQLKFYDYENNYIDTLLFKNENDGVYFYTEKGQKYLVFKYPVKVGDKWFNVFEAGQIECISTNTSIQTPAGKFSCVVYRFSGKEEDQSLKAYTEVYMSPNVGWVASKEIEDGQSDKWFYLKSYHLK